jgi:hypothetical protein
VTTSLPTLIKFKALQNGVLVQPAFRKEFCLEKMNTGDNRLCFTSDIILNLMTRKLPLLKLLIGENLRCVSKTSQNKFP